MAVKTFYGTNPFAASSLFSAYSETSPGANATSSPAFGIQVGTATPTKYKELAAREERTAPTGEAALPDATINNGGATNHSGWRTPETLTGTFAAGKWVFHHVMRSTVGTTAKVAVTVRVWRGSNPEGTGATLLTASLLTGSTITMSTSADGDSVLEWEAPEITLSGEYLFVETAIKIVGAGSSSTDNAVFRYGETGVRAVTTNFTAAEEGSAPLHRMTLLGVGA